jgi:outer membrane protein insertion porin family
MKLTLSVLAICILIAGAAQAAQNEADKTGPSQSDSHAETHTDIHADTHTDTAHKAAQPAYRQDLDKIDDVNPYVIKSVIIEGNKLVSRSQIKAVIKTKPGDFYHRKDVEEDLKAIDKLGYFDHKNLHIDSEATAAGLVLTIHVKENPFFKSITFSGNHILPTTQLQELFKEQLQKTQSTTQIHASIEKIENLYHNQDYILASVTDIQTDPTGKMTIVINEGIVKEIKISGANDEQTSVLQKALTVKVGDPYNEKQVKTDLRAALKLAKFGDLTREVALAKDNSGYILIIKTMEKAPAATQKGPGAPLKLLSPTKSKPSLPVLNRFIHSPMYKDIK